MTGSEKKSSGEYIKKYKPFLTDLENQIQGLSQKVDVMEKSGLRGHPLVDLRNSILANYTICLTEIIKLKIEGKTIVSNPLIFQSAKLRVILEKMEPLLKKISPAITRRLRDEAYGIDNSQDKNFDSLAPSGATQNSPTTNAILGEQSAEPKTDQNDPLAFKPQVSQFLGEKTAVHNIKSSSSVKAREEEPKIDDKNDSGAYRVNKAISVRYPHERIDAKQSKNSGAEREKRRIAQSSIFESIRDDLRSASGLPEKLSAGVKSLDHQKMREIKKIMEKEEYELNNFVRLGVTKKEKKRRRELEKMVSCDTGGQILQSSREFEQLSNFGRGSESNAGSKRGVKETKKPGKKSKKGKKKKFKRRK